MKRVVLDVNVIVSGFPSSTGAPSEIIERWLHWEFELVLSDHILNRAENAWQNPYYRTHYLADEVRKTIDLLRERATLVVPEPIITRTAAHEEDDIVLAAAIAGAVTDLVTGDKELLRLGEIDGIPIVSPRQFLTSLNAIDE